MDNDRYFELNKNFYLGDETCNTSLTEIDALPSLQSEFGVSMVCALLKKKKP